MERKSVYNSILAWREKERNVQNEREFPLPEPIYDVKNLFCTLDFGLCIFIGKNSYLDFELCVPSKLIINYD